MPTYLDVHTVDGGVSASDVAGAHQADLKTQAEYGVDYKRYWVDEKAGKIFCLVDAPDAETATRVHREAHGLVADEIYGAPAAHSIGIELRAVIKRIVSRGKRIYEQAIS
jgi:hypothetical protein